MKKDDLKEMAKRCRLMARTADSFTKRRLLDLASRYEARLTSRPPPPKQPISTMMANVKIEPTRRGSER
jgi:hypothetical protein